MLQIRRRKNGNLAVSLSREEALVLCQLPARLRGVLRRPDFERRLIERLFPRAYRDEAREAEYQRLLGGELIDRKLECLHGFESNISSWLIRGKKVEITVEPDDFELWLGFVNDMRLLLGAELEIQEESWKQTFDHSDPRALDMALLHYLTWLEAELLSAKGFEDPPKAR